MLRTCFISEKLIIRETFFPKCLQMMRNLMDEDTNFITKEKYNQVIDLWTKKDFNPIIFEEYLTVLLSHGIYAVLESDYEKDRKIDYVIAAKKVELGNNFINYLKAYDLNISEISVVYVSGYYPRDNKFNYLIGMSIVHSGTIDFLSRIRIPTITSNFVNLAKSYLESPYFNFVNTFFGLSVLLNYNIIKDVNELEFITTVQGGININQNVNGYFLENTTIQRYFNFFQSMVNAGTNVKYRLIPNFILNQKIQTDNNAGEGPFIIIRPLDLLINPKFTFFLWGMKFLNLEMEIFKRHLNYLDTNCSPQNIIPRCHGNIETVDLEVFKITQDSILNDIVPPKPKFNKSSYLEYLGLVDNISSPIHNFAIYTTVPTEQAYETNITIKSPSNEKRRESALLIRTGFINKIIPENIIGDYVYRRTDNSKIYTENFKQLFLVSFSKFTDVLSGMVYTHQKVFRNVSLGTLPLTPIKSIYGDLPSCWLWVLNDKGSFDVILVTSGLELVAKHISLALNTSMSIIAAGELRIQKNGDIIYNINSGTFAFGEKSFLYGEIKEKFLYLLGGIIVTNFNEYSNKNIYFTNKELIPSSFSPLQLELSLLCSGFGFEDRLYVGKFLDKFYYTKPEFKAFKREESNKKFCNIRKKVSSTMVTTNDFPLKEAQKISINPKKFYSILRVADIKVSDSIKLTHLLEKGEVKFVNECNLKKGYKNYIILKKTSASSSMTILGEVNLTQPIPNYIALKIFPSSDDLSKDNSLERELQVYRSVPFVVKEFVTPNLLLYISNFKCKANNFFSNQEEYNQYINIIKNSKDKNRTDVTNLNILMIEWVQGKSLNDFIQEHKEEVTEEFLRSIIFQVVYTVTVLNRLNLQQNDLHVDNIWLTKLPYKTYFSYFVTEKFFFLVPVSYVCKIFDFDFSLVEGVENTKMKKFPFEYNIIREQNDVITFICQLERSIGRTGDSRLLNLFLSIKTQILKHGKVTKYCRPRDIRDSNIEVLKRTLNIWDLEKGFDKTYLQRGKEDFDFWFQDTNLKYSDDYIGRIFAFDLTTQDFKIKHREMTRKIGKNISEIILINPNFNFPPLKL